jgi:hypothetical protein
MCRDGLRTPRWSPMMIAACESARAKGLTGEYEGLMKWARFEAGIAAESMDSESKDNMCT